MKRVLGRLCLVLISLAAGLGLGEALVRVLAPHARDAALPGRLLAIDPELGWKLAPSKTATHHSRYFSALYATNPDGFRDRPRARVAAGHVRRILLYGDSLVFGWGLNQGERFSDLLENAQDGLEVLNHAVPGYGLDQEVILYEREGESLGADEVIFVVAASTLTRLDSGFIYSKYKPRFTHHDGVGLALVPVPQRRAAFVSLIYDTLSPFYLPYLLETGIARVRDRLEAEGTSRRTLRQQSRPLVDDLAKNVLRLAWTTAQRRHHRMTILVAELSPADRWELGGFCRETGVACAEITLNRLAGRKTDARGELVFGAHDGHWNARANKLIAEQLHEPLMMR